MAFRCSVFGCEYDDTEIEREEERRGDEVIMTVREFKECANCGNRELISENTGVMSAVDGTGDESDDADPGAESGPEPTKVAATAEAAGSTDDAGPDHGEDVGGADATPDGEFDDADGGILLGDDGGDGVAPAPDGTDPLPTSADDGDVRTADPDPLGSLSGDELDDDGGPESFEDATVQGSVDGAIREAERADEAREATDDDTTTGDGSDQGPPEEGEYPEDDAVILTSSASDTGTAGAPAEPATAAGPTDGSTAADGGDRWPDHDDGADDRWPDHDDDHDVWPGETEEGDWHGSGDEDVWPDHEGDDEGWDARPDDGADHGVEFSGLTPTADDERMTGSRSPDASTTPVADSAGSDRSTPTDPDAGSGRGEEAARSDRDPSEDPTIGSGRVERKPADDDPIGGGTAAVTAERERTDDRRSPDTRGGRSSGTQRDSGTAGSGGDAPGSAGRQLFCSGCGHAVVRSETAHRAGDICPECAKEYLAER